MRTFHRKRDEDRAPRRGWSWLKLRVKGSRRERVRGRGGGHRLVHTYNFWAWLMRLYRTLICGDQRNVLAELEGEAPPAPTRPLPRPNPSRAPSPSPSPAWPPANTGLTSYFCCFSFAIRSNFSDSSWWIQSDSSWAFSLAGQKGCWGREPGRAPGPEGLTEPFEFGFTGAIVLIIWGSFVNMQSRSQQGGL